MKYLAVILLSILSWSIQAQQPDLLFWFDNTAADSSATGLATSVHLAGPTYSATAYQGTHSYNPASTEHIETASFDVGNTFSISGWIRASGTNSRTIVTNEANATGNGFAIRISSDNSLNIITYNSGGTFDLKYTAAGVYNDNTWFHFVVVVNRLTLSANIYINNVYVSQTGGIRSDFATSSALSIGAYKDGTNSATTDYIDNLQVYKRLLNVTEIDSLYNHGTEKFYLSMPDAAPPPSTVDGNFINHQLAASYINDLTVSRYVIYPRSAPSYPDTVINDFTGKVLYVCEVDGNNENDGLAQERPIKITGITATIDTTFDYIVFSDTTHYGTFTLNNIDNTYGSKLKIQTWNKYGRGYATIAGLTNVGGWTQSGNYWTRTGLTGLPAKRNDIFNQTGEDYDFYTKSGMNGLYINGTWYGMSRYPDNGFLSMESRTIAYLPNGEVDYSNTFMRDNQGIATSGYWNGGMVQTQVMFFVPSKLTISSYLSTGAFFFADVYGSYTSEWSNTQKYFIINHHNAANLNGEWTQNFSTGNIEVYYNGNLNDQTVQLPLVDDCIRIVGSDYIQIKQLNFIGANKAQIRASNSTGLTITQCNFSQAPVAAVATFGIDTLSITYCNVNISTDNGFVGLENDYEVYKYNRLSEIGVNYYGGDRDGRHMQGICVNQFYGSVYIENNIIDSCGYNGIGHYVAMRDGAYVHDYRNWINYSNMVMSDGASIYASAVHGTTQKYIRGNLITNTYENRAYNATGADLSVGIYLDSAYPDECTSGGVKMEHRKWDIDSNITWNVAKNFFININNTRHRLINNTAVSMTSYANYDSEGYYYKNSYTDCKTPDSLEITHNTFIMGPNGGKFMHSESWNRFYPATNVVDYNDYRDPFAVDSDVWWTSNDANGSPAYEQYYFTLPEIRALTPWEDHSTLNDPSWLMGDVTGITEDQMIWMYANWTATAHTFDLGSTVYKNLDGDDVSTSITVQPYKAVVLFYKSGAVPTHDNLTVYR
jgi:hypothetical protein